MFFQIFTLWWYTVFVVDNIQISVVSKLKKLNISCFSRTVLSTLKICQLLTWPRVGRIRMRNSIKIESRIRIWIGLKSLPYVEPEFFLTWWQSPEGVPSSARHVAEGRHNPISPRNISCCAGSSSGSGSGTCLEKAGTRNNYPPTTRPGSFFRCKCHWIIQEIKKLGRDRASTVPTVA